MTIFLEPIIEVVAGFLLKQIIQRGPDYAKTVREKLGRPQLPRLSGFFVSRVRLINRDDEQESIAAVLNEAPQSRTIYFSGVGGVGKTRLLEEAEHLVKNSRGNPPLYWAGILDLYHPDLRSALSLQDALAQRLDPDQTYFIRYRARRTRLEQRRRAGLRGSALDKERQVLFNVFLQDYNAFAQHYRPVLAFDTLESLAHESDLIQTLCRLETPVTTAWTWLLTQAKELNNTVILLAGRPQPITGQKLKEKHNDTPGRLETISLEGLTRENSRRLLEYFLADAAPELRSLHQQADQLWELTKGLPVQLALVTELVAQNKQIDPMKLSNTANPAIWGRELVRTLFDYDNQQTRLFFFLALARRGLTVDLLNFLSGWTVEACQKKLEDINRLSVVKTRPGSAETFLHDALYELFDAYFPFTDRLSYWYQRLVDYYRTQQSRAGNNREAWGKATISLLHYSITPQDLRYLRESCGTKSGREINRAIT